LTIQRVRVRVPPETLTRTVINPGEQEMQNEYG